MILKSKRYVLLSALLIFVLYSTTDCKRGGGRRGGTYRGSSNVWGRAKQSQNGQSNYDMYAQRRSKSQSSDPIPDPNKKADAPKASAPPAPSTNAQKPSTGDSSASFIQQEKKQQVAPVNTANTQQRPIGWDVGQASKPEGTVNKNVGWNVGNANPAQGAGYGNTGNQQSSYAGAYPKGTYPNAGSYPNTGAYPNTGVHPNGGAYPNTGAYPNAGVHPNGGAYPNTGAYPNAGVHPNGGAYPNAGAYPNTGVGGYYGSGGNYNYGNGYHNSPQYPGYGPNSNFGNMHGNGGYGGYGGFGGGFGGYGNNGVGGYGKRFGGGFGSSFGKHAVRNVIVGLLVWNLVSGLTRRPYYVYNYHNNPEQVPQEISLPANLIVLCPENVTELCAPNTAPLCTSNSTILCVVLAQQTVPCGDNSTLKCANSTASCTDEEPCDGKESKNVTIPVNIPCVTNATIVGKLMDNSTILFSGSGSWGESTNFCVTTLAVPQPEEDANKGVAPLCNGQVDGANATSPCTGNSTDLPQGAIPGVDTNVTVPVQNATFPPLAM